MLEHGVIDDEVPFGKRGDEGSGTGSYDGQQGLERKSGSYEGPERESGNETWSRGRRGGEEERRERGEGGWVVVREGEGVVGWL